MADELSGLTDEEQGEVSTPWTDDALERFGLRSVVDGGTLFCLQCLTMPFAIGGVRHQWPKGSTVSWHIGMSRLGNLSDMDMKAARERTCAEIESYVRDLKLVYNPNGKTANIVCTAVPMDGPSGVLADHQLPMGNMNSGAQLLGRFDSRENWVLSRTAVQGAIDWERTDKHEFGHAMGFGHGAVVKSDPAMLEPSYSWSIFMYQPRDIIEWQARYGVAEVPSSPQLPPIGEHKVNFSVPGLSGEITLNPTAAGCAAKLMIEREGKRVSLSGSKSWA